MARPRPFDPQRFDVGAFAAAGSKHDAVIGVPALTRLSGAVMPTPGDVAPADIHWRVGAEVRKVAGGAAQTWLHLVASTAVTLECQRCLQPLLEPLAVDRWFRFVASEEEAELLDEESDEDVLVASRAFNLQALIEDELILALPLVPRHTSCPQPLPAAIADEAAEEPASNPFAALAALRRRPQ